jgi:hypothetical protein
MGRKRYAASPFVLAAEYPDADRHVEALPMPSSDLVAPPSLKTPTATLTVRRNDDL